uniref:Coat protein n=1 Tax=Tobacco rattle virus TaxID=12295 RepID=A0A0U3TEK7_9VIRU|nr:coat protein [Tobacco rattle virus]
MGSYGDSFEGKILDDLSQPWCEKHNWADVLRRLSKIKFALQNDRDMIPGILEDLTTELPVDEVTRFPLMKIYYSLSKEVMIAIETIHSASSFKRRAEEKNNVNPRQRFEADTATTLVTPGGGAIRPAGSGDSALTEDAFSHGKLDDASTAFHKSLAMLKGERLKAYTQRGFEKEYGLKWTGSAPATSSGGGKGPVV